MLRKLALLYVVIATFEYGYRLVVAIQHGVFSAVQPWIALSLNIAGLTAVYAYARRRDFMHEYAWRALLVAYVALRIIELAPSGLFVSGAPLESNLGIAVQYALYVVPSVMCLAFLSFRHREENAL